MATQYFSHHKILQHTLGTPLSTILLNSEMALKLADSSSPKKNYFHHLNQVFLSAKYIERILTMDENSATTHTSFKVNQALQEVLSLTKTPHSNLNLIAHLNLDSTVKLQGNQLYFQEAIICLLNNAVESYPSHTKQKTVLLESHLQENTLQIHISDGGQGFSWWQKQQLKYFSPKSTKSHHSGVGFSFAKKVICKTFQGKISVDSKRNRGTTVKILIPRVHGSESLYPKPRTVLTYEPYLPSFTRSRRI